jgi:hypothetical protein
MNNSLWVPLHCAALQANDIAPDKRVRGLVVTFAQLCSRVAEIQQGDAGFEALDDLPGYLRKRPRSPAPQSGRPRGNRWLLELAAN